MQAELLVKDILIDHFAAAQARNNRCSMRGYAKKIGLAQSALSSIFHGKRPITRKMAQKILSGLCVEPSKVAEILSAYENPQTTEPAQPDTFRNLSIEHFHLISEWQHFAILSLSETKGFRSDPAWIAKRLGISEQKVQLSIARLDELGMIKINPRTKKWIPTGIQYRIDPGVATAALKKANRENLELASTALETTRFEQRDFTALTLCFDPARMTEAKEMLKTFRSTFCTKMEETDKKEVYKLCIQLFPLSKEEETK